MLRSLASRPIQQSQAIDQHLTPLPLSILNARKLLQSRRAGIRKASDTQAAREVKISAVDIIRKAGGTLFQACAVSACGTGQIPTKYMSGRMTYCLFVDRPIWEVTRGSRPSR